MSFIKSLFELSKQEKKFREKRKFPRYDVNDKYPLDVKVNSKTLKLMDVSAGGMRVETNFDVVENQIIDIDFALKGSKFKLKGLVRHTSPYIGIEVATNDFKSYKAFAQMISPIIIGSTLKEYDQTNVKQDASGFRKRVFFAEGSCCLTLWVSEEDPESFEKFEFEIDEVCLRGDHDKFVVLRKSEVQSAKSNIHRSDILVGVTDDPDTIYYMEMLELILAHANALDDKIKKELQAIPGVHRYAS